MNHFERPVEGYKSVVKAVGQFAEARKERYRPLTDGIKDANRRLCLEHTLDVMFRSQAGPEANFEMAKAVLSGDKAAYKRLAEETDTSNVATYVKHIFPVVTRTFWVSQLFNLIGVQPLSGPTGRIFYQDIIYSSSGGLYDPSLYSSGARVDQFIDPYYSISSEAPGDAVRELSMTMVSTDVTVETRRLNAKWTDELEQDLRSLFGMEMDSLMVQNLGDEIAREVDQSGIDVLVAGATAGNVNWSATATGVYSTLDPKVWAATLWDALIDADQMVWEAMNRNTTWIIAGATEVNRLRKLGTHKLVGGPAGPGTARSALEFQGLLEGRWEVWQARHFPSGKFLLGYRGTDFSDTGAVHSPYLPMEVKDAVKNLDGDNAYKTIRGVQWRGRTHVVNGDAFSTVTVTE